MQTKKSTRRSVTFWGMIWLSLVGFSFPCYGQSSKNTVYDRIDQHVLNTPRKAERSLQSLASYLVKPAQNEYEKVRAIYRWVTYNVAYDTKGYFTGIYGDLSPEGVLKSRRAVCGGYAGIFKHLGKAAGLKVIKVSGYSKGYGYKVGEQFTGLTNHAWNVVKIQGRWYLLDSTWGSGYLDENKKFVHRFQEYYFLTPPEEFIYTHFPENSRWQLLEQPISKEDYANLVYLSPAYFTTGFKVKSHPQSVIKAGDQVAVTLLAPEYALLLAQLNKDNQELDKSLTFVQKYSGEFSVHAIFPRPGNYVLRLFSKRKNDIGSYNWTLDYRVEASKGMSGRVGFPESYEEFGKSETYLFSPMNGKLKSGTTQTFKLNVPKAEKVAVIVDGQWNYLIKQGDNFVGDVIIQKGGVSVCAKFPGKSQYSGLLKYKGY